jgi:hypothetical protein
MALVSALILSSGLPRFATAALPPTEQWGVAELEFPGPSAGNPFVEVELTAEFTQGGKVQTVSGFYDGDGVYRIHFMPDQPGDWRYETRSNVAELDGQTGEVKVVPATGKNHGPVRVAKTFHFAYADGKPYKPVGTTCYAWTHQPAELQEQTLKTLAASPFNKLRMCVFPKRYTWNTDEPTLYPFEGTAPNQWDFSRPNPAFFRHLEQLIRKLGELGIEADVILFHPYDEGHWGFDRMTDAQDDAYLSYVVARLAAYRNVWWSLANEYDFMLEKQESDWHRLIDVVQRADPYGRLCSIHNGRQIYNHTHPALTHASIQNGSAVEDAGRAVLYRDAYRKPIVYDEVKYEGDIPSRWGNLSAEEMVHRFWEGTVAGTYIGHGECYLNPDDVLWWAKGGVLHGESPARIAFLRDVLATAPAEGIEPIDKWQYPEIGGQPARYYLVYLGEKPAKSWRFALPRYDLKDGMKFRVEVLDTWNMTTTPVEQEFTVKQESEYLFVDKDGRTVDLPGKPWMALRITRAGME